MQRVIVCRSMTLLVPLWLAFGAAAQGNENRVELTQPDQYAIRSMHVLDKSRNPIPGLIRLDSFDRSTKTFIFQTPAGEAQRIPATDIDTIEFAQDLQKANPVAQMPPSTITVLKEEPRKLQIAADKLRIEAGGLFVDTLDADRPLAGGEQFEVRNISFNPAQESFDVELQRVRYNVEFSGGGGGGLSGMRK